MESNQKPTEQMTTPTFKVGDRIAWSAKFLRSIADYSADSANQLGTVMEIKDYGLKAPVLKVKWDGDDRPLEESCGVLATNAVLENRIHLEPA